LRKHERLPNRARHRRLLQRFFGADIQQRVEQASIREVELGAFDDGFGSVRKPRLKQDYLSRGLKRR
jgi:hypothetical protein